MAAQSSAERRLELVSTVLLALATVATAWAAYQSRQWTGQQTRGTALATANRIAVNRVSAVANRQAEIDVATFIQWVNAHEHHDSELADFYRARFRDEFKPAFNAWVATKPLQTAGAPPTPFALPEYRLAAEAEAARLDRNADALSAQVHRNIQRASNYVLGVVLFAVALFFAGMSTKLKAPVLRKTMLVVGYVIFLAAAVWIATSPVSVAV